MASIERGVDQPYTSPLFNTRSLFVQLSAGGNQGPFQNGLSFRSPLGYARGRLRLRNLLLLRNLLFV
jgi:hypothetical protein